MSESPPSAVIPPAGTLLSISGSIPAELHALRESEARFRATFERAPVGLAHVGISGEWLAVNARLCDLLGYSRDELLATRFQALTHPNDLAADLDQALKLVAGEVASYTMPKRYVRKDGTVVWARLTGSLVRDVAGAPFHFLAVIDEITGPEVARLHAAAADAEWLAAALAAAHDGAYDWDLSSGTIHYSAEWCRMLGHAPDDITPHDTSWQARVHPDDLAGTLEAIQAHIDGRTARFAYEHRMRRKDGGWMWVLSRGQVLTRDAGGRALRIVGTHKDITTRREWAAALAASAEVARRQLAELEAVYGGAPVGLGFIGPDLRYVRVNARLATLNGAPPEAHVGRTPSEVTPSLAPAIEPLLRGVLTTGQPVRGLEFRAEAPGEPGAVRDWMIDYYPAIDTTAAVVGVTCAVAEITALKRAEAVRDALLAREEAARAAADAARADAEAARVASEGARARAEEADRAKSAFLATMSHELRTPLNAIGGHVQLIEMGIHGPVTEAQQDALARINHAQRHLLRLINEVLDTARLEASRVGYDLRDVPVAGVVAELEALVGPQVREKRLSLVVDVDPGGAVRADRDKLVQVLLNLVANAIKFTSVGGTVSIDTPSRASGDDDPRVVHLRVRDTGIGISPHLVDHVFDPFVQADTTPAGRAAGTGLGLAISRDLARGMGGDVRARSTPGVGSSFTVTLPRAGA